EGAMAPLRVPPQRDLIQAGEPLRQQTGDRTLVTPPDARRKAFLQQGKVLCLRVYAPDPQKDPIGRPRGAAILLKRIDDENVGVLDRAGHGPPQAAEHTSSTIQAKPCNTSHAPQDDPAARRQRWIEDR